VAWLSKFIGPDLHFLWNDAVMHVNKYQPSLIPVKVKQHYYKERYNLEHYLRNTEAIKCTWLCNCFDYVVFYVFHFLAVSMVIQIDIITFDREAMSSTKTTKPYNITTVWFKVVLNTNNQPWQCWRCWRATWRTLKYPNAQCCFLITSTTCSLSAEHESNSFHYYLFSLWHSWCFQHGIKQQLITR
jgi:hypothetical protein